MTLPQTKPRAVGKAAALAAALVLPLSLGAGVSAAQETLTGLRFCNRTANTVSVAVGHFSADQGAWISEGWWNLGSEVCGTVIPGALRQRYYYFHAVDARLGGRWTGTAYMCTQLQSFSIVGAADCLARGYDRSGFVEVDTGDAPYWTVILAPEGAGAGVVGP